MRDRIHYACGRNVLSGWLNVDGIDASYPHGSVEPEKASQIFRTDLTEPHPFGSGVFRFGYAEDLLEHFDQAESIIFLAEAFRTLRDGGVLRLSFPGLKGALREHLKSSDFQGGHYMRHVAYKIWWHRHFYCEEELELVGKAIGFRSSAWKSMVNQSIPNSGIWKHDPIRSI